MTTPIFVDDCHKIHIGRLFKSRQHQQNSLPNCNLPFRTVLSDDGFWLEIPGLGKWAIVGQAIGNDVGGCSEGWKRPQWKAFLYVVGQDGRRCKFLLITKDLKRAGTRLELKAVFRSQWIKSNKRRIQSRAKILRQLGILYKPDILSLIFVPYNKPKGQYHFTYERNMRANPNIALVRKPLNMKLRRFYLLLNRIKTSGAMERKYKPILKIYPVRKHRTNDGTDELLSRLRRY